MNTTTPEKCPKCGAGAKLIALDSTYYTCKTRIIDNGEVIQTPMCIRTQRDQLSERVKELEKKHSWRPIRTCPHNLEWVLGYDEKDGEIGMIIYDWKTTEDFTMRSWTDGMRTWTPTHWMPLPEPPKEKGCQ